MNTPLSLRLSSNKAGSDWEKNSWRKDGNSYLASKNIRRRAIRPRRPVIIRLTSHKKTKPIKKEEKP